MFQVWVGTLNIMERDREREKAGEKKIKKKKKRKWSKDSAQVLPNSSLAMAKSKDPHRAYYMIGSVIWPNDPSARNKS